MPLSASRVLVILLGIAISACTSGPRTVEAPYDGALPDPSRWCEGGVGGLTRQGDQCVTVGAGYPCVYVSVTDGRTRRPIRDARVWIQRESEPLDSGVPARDLMRWFALDAEYYMPVTPTQANWCSGTYVLTVEHPNYQMQTRVGRAFVDREISTNTTPDRYDFVLSP